MPVYDDDGVTELKEKSYVLEPIIERIGCYCNLNDKYYTDKAVFKYDSMRKELLREMKVRRKRGDDIKYFEGNLSPEK